MASIQQILSSLSIAGITIAIFFIYSSRKTWISFSLQTIVQYKDFLNYKVMSSLSFALAVERQILMFILQKEKIKQTNWTNVGQLINRDIGSLCSQGKKGHLFLPSLNIDHHRQEPRIFWVAQSSQSVCPSRQMMDAYLTQMGLQFLHFSVLWGVKHHLVLVSHLPGIISVQVIWLRRGKPERQTG